MSAHNFQCTSLLLSKVVKVQSEQNNQGYQEMKRTRAVFATNIRPQKKYWSRKTTKTMTYDAFYASKLLDNVDEGLLFQNIPTPKYHPC